MDLIPCDSSFIAAFGYDPDTATLGVRFKSGAIFNYAGVPPDTFEDMQNADSVGKFFHANINGKFDSAKQEPDETEAS